MTEARKIAETIGHVRPSRGDTCETQRDLAAQSSRIDTIIAGREVVYVADKACPAPPAGAAPAVVKPGAPVAPARAPAAAPVVPKGPTKVASG